MKTLAALSAAPLLAAPLLAGAAHAQDVTKAYVQVHGGAFFQTGDALALEAVGAADEPIAATLDLDPDVGFAVGGLVGYEVLLGLSVEGEATFRSNSLDFDGVLPAIFPAPPDGREETVTIMLNAAYTLAVPFLADPYAGVGIGYVTPMGDTSDFDGAFAYQAKAGLAWPVGVGRAITEVAYLGTDGLEASGNLNAQLDYGGVSALAGYRFAF